MPPNWNQINFKNVKIQTDSADKFANRITRGLLRSIINSSWKITQKNIQFTEILLLNTESVIYSP